MWNGAAIDWRISVSKGVALSATEAELYALTRLCQLLAQCARVLKDLGVEAKNYYPFQAYSDSKGAIAQGDNPVSNTAMIHIDNKHFFCREMRQRRQVAFKWISRAMNAADIGTHVMSDPVMFERFAAFLMNSGIIPWTRAQWQQ